ncbi:MAG: phenylalanine--tRNA ligase subunit alpha [Microcystis sp.]|jgi:phenylalanyl-tRNA synthetase alpha chain|uniref:Phenylalanine--tRNA ligase alpha subunit n=1 Tax=Microcystis aeruginosa G11-04 TaxID=2685956 RepID=A0A966L2L2_MICAE|nr:phenylalanine--tRNA ligase subunit alpha [Microcystis aeruginosa WS75]NCQ68347.1 phenylalanine--tRNA ligase subunit alpha [Microcystis aeruginosa W13-16]NCQ72832.1 phenylalanine--tRNA ligase subunit alpha [Microcystis aeruginosa W13-13]NCQ77317.1 phenylalanine--tRNA ligase subunit alpha [Microcystis aeruginosa W13-15]NCR11384.1 phenylalanine--tRNA ligase subunit alpha [Microcystis aeruginosa SX13-11]NCR17757.1 phenylalanine--tRNA ligase subunit alpha [Microcystis aeruginosa LL13-03]NCR2114
MSLSPHPIETALKTLAAKAENSIEQTTNLEDLEQLRVNYLGKKGELSQILREMGKLTPEERPRLGAIANQVKELVQSLLESQRESLNNAQIQAKLAAETLDVTLPALSRPLGRIHPLNSTVDRMIDIFVGLGYSIATGPQVESDYYNFEALNIPADHPARDMQDTFFLSDGRLLRTHTSPVQIRYMESHEPPIRIVAPGRVYRRDTVDATHSAVFHQVELLAVDQGLTFTDLKGTIKEFLKQMFGADLPVKFRASYFPFTEPSAEVDVQWKGKWLEVMGCGMVDPNVLKAVGYDPQIYTGFAAGFGVERFAMVLHEIDDIRRCYNSDIRFLRQF